MENWRKKPEVLLRTAESGGGKHPRAQDCVATCVGIADLGFDQFAFRPSASAPTTTYHPTGRCTFRSFENNNLQNPY
jgi:hypothetical protein